MYVVWTSCEYATFIVFLCRQWDIHMNFKILLVYCISFLHVRTVYIMFVLYTKYFAMFKKSTSLISDQYCNTVVYTEICIYILCNRVMAVHSYVHYCVMLACLVRQVCTQLKSFGNCIHSNFNVIYVVLKDRYVSTRRV